MTDFVYDSDDISAMRVASKNLKDTEQRWFIPTALALGTYLIFEFASRNKPNAAWKMRSPLILALNGLVISGVMYSLVTWRTRSRYDHAAKLINTKYTSIISRTLNYQK